jgi:hypothetical protein
VNQKIVGDLQHHATSITTDLQPTEAMAFRGLALGIATGTGLAIGTCSMSASTEHTQINWSLARLVVV